jgi:hypothetical protein
MDLWLRTVSVGGITVQGKRDERDENRVVLHVSRSGETRTFPLHPNIYRPRMLTAAERYGWSQPVVSDVAMLYVALVHATQWGWVPAVHIFVSPEEVFKHRERIIPLIQYIRDSAASADLVKWAEAALRDI